MVIYIEYLFIDNMSVDLLLLYLTAVTLREKAGALRLILSAFIGTASAFFLPFIPEGLLIPYKCAAAILMTAVFKNKSLKAYLSRLAVFVGYSFFLGGIIFGLFNLRAGVFAGSAALGGHVFTATLLGCILLFLLARKLYTERKKKKNELCRYKTMLFVGVVEEELLGYHDTGNKLFDKDRMPVAILSRDVGRRIAETANIELMSINIDTVGGKNTLCAFKIDRLMIYSGKRVNIFENSTVAIADKSFNGFKILLHEEMV